MRRESASNQLIWFLSHLKKKLISEKITSRRKFIHDFVKAEAERDTSNRVIKLMAIVI